MREARASWPTPVSADTCTYGGVQRELRGGACDKSPDTPTLVGNKTPDPSHACGTPIPQLDLGRPG